MPRGFWLVASVLAATLALAACSTPPATSRASVVYRCADGSQFNAQFGAESVLITLPDGSTLNLPQQRAASGIWYATPQYTLRGKGDEATWTVGRRVPVDCRVQR